MTDILEKIGMKEALAQLAEEATELAHAALKFRRAIDQSSPTDKSLDEAVDNFYEEVADVIVCMAVMSLNTDEVDEIARQKYNRWKDRLGLTKKKKTPKTVDYEKLYHNAIRYLVDYEYTTPCEKLGYDDWCEENCPCNGDEPIPDECWERFLEDYTK